MEGAPRPVQGCASGASSRDARSCAATHCGLCSKRAMNSFSRQWSTPSRRQWPTSGARSASSAARRSLAAVQGQGWRRSACKAGEWPPAAACLRLPCSCALAILWHSPPSAGRCRRSPVRHTKAVGGAHGDGAQEVLVIAHVEAGVPAEGDGRGQRAGDPWQSQRRGRTHRAPAPCTVTALLRLPHHQHSAKQRAGTHARRTVISGCSQKGSCSPPASCIAHLMCGHCIAGVECGRGHKIAALPPPGGNIGCRRRRRRRHGPVYQEPRLPAPFLCMAGRRTQVCFVAVSNLSCCWPLLRFSLTHVLLLEFDRRGGGGAAACGRLAAAARCALAARAGASAGGPGAAALPGRAAQPCSTLLAAGPGQGSEHRARGRSQERHLHPGALDASGQVREGTAATIGASNAGFQALSAAPTSQRSARGGGSFGAPSVLTALPSISARVQGPPRPCHSASPWRAPA